VQLLTSAISPYMDSEPAYVICDSSNCVETELRGCVQRYITLMSGDRLRVKRNAEYYPSFNSVCT